MLGPVDLSGSRLEWLRDNDAELMATLRYLEVFKIERRHSCQQRQGVSMSANPDDALASPLHVCRNDDYYARRMVHNERVARLLSVDDSTAAPDADNTAVLSLAPQPRPVRRRAQPSDFESEKRVSPPLSGKSTIALLIVVLCSLLTCVIWIAWIWILAFIFGPRPR